MGHFGILLKIHYKDIMRTQEDKSGAHWGSAPTADAYCYNCGPKDGQLIVSKLEEEVEKYRHTTKTSVVRNFKFAMHSLTHCV